jgi:hypothetical protein
MKQGKGFLIFALNTQEVNYLEHAYFLAKSIKETQINNQVAVVVNKTTNVTSSIFDHVITIDRSEDQIDFSHELLAFKLSPFTQTIKVESDMIFTASIDHWWEILDQKNVVFTNRVETYRNEPITNRSQRKIFDDNDLPDIYTGLYYFRYSKEAMQFFSIAKQVYDNWVWLRDVHLKNCRTAKPITDEAFAIAAKLWGVENCTIQNSIPSFVHMKNILQGLPQDGNWWDYRSFEKNDGIHLGFYRQQLPLHYHNKTFIEELRKHYD